MNSLSSAEHKRRGMAAIEEGLRRGPVHITKHNKAAAVVLSEEDYARLARGKENKAVGMTALQWLLSQPSRGTVRKEKLDRELRDERESWK